MKKQLIEIFGWYGVAAILTAYTLVSFSHISADSLTYQALNATGAVGIMIDAYYARNYQPVVLNIVWLIIALIALFQIWF